MNNFEFLKSIDKTLYEIIAESEKLYRDEYFEQSTTQTRRFAENVCKNVLGDMRTSEKTFDEMLATLKDKACNSEQEKEFIDDLYFIKREGNKSAHSNVVKKDGIIALECLQRAYEVAINYAVYYKKSKPSLLKMRYDTEILVTGKKTEKILAEKYKEAKKKDKKLKKIEKRNYKAKTVTSSKKTNSIFKYILYFSFSVSFALILAILLLLVV